MPPIIRPIRADEAEALRDIRLAALADCPTSFTADFNDEKDRNPWLDRAQQGTGDGKDLILLAEADGQIVGMTGVLGHSNAKLRHNGIVWGVYVRPVYRAQGIGHRLLQAAIAWGREKRLVKLVLSVTVGNPARKLYERLGFVEYGVEPMAVRWEGRFYDEAQMVLRL
jgi:GNAT superfamily N-acetyltransferase